MRVDAEPVVAQIFTTHSHTHHSETRGGRLASMSASHPSQVACSKLESATPSALLPQAFRTAPAILTGEWHALLSLFNVS